MRKNWVNASNFATYIEPYSSNTWEMEEYSEMLESVYKNGGFYIGRYETTIDGITWSYRYQDETATDVDYINGTLTEVVTIPSELDGYTVVSINLRSMI